MKTIEILELDDIIMPNDLVRRAKPLGWFSQGSDDQGESCIYWQYAKWSLTFWVGKTLREMYNFGNDKSSHDPIPVCVIRLPKGCNPEDLNGLFMDKPPCQKTQKIYEKIMKEQRSLKHKKGETHV